MQTLRLPKTPRKPPGSFCVPTTRCKKTFSFGGSTESQQGSSAAQLLMQQPQKSDEPPKPARDSSKTALLPSSQSASLNQSNLIARLPKDLKAKLLLAAAAWSESFLHLILKVAYGFLDSSRNPSCITICTARSAHKSRKILPSKWQKRTAHFS